MLVDMQMVFLFRLFDEHDKSTGVDAANRYSGSGLATGAQRPRSRRHCDDWIGKDNIGESFASSY